MRMGRGVAASFGCTLARKPAAMQRFADVARRGFASPAAGQHFVQKTPFPSLTITCDGVTAQGSFAEQQHEFLEPDMSSVNELAKTLREKNIGVVAHFYMDAELQGTLVKVSEQWEHVFCADSLAMGFAAVEMAQKGVKAIACLGVDFMAESVKAYLNQNGFYDVPVLRLKEGAIGCSLAESAEAEVYTAFLKQARAELDNPLHVVYINTSLQTKSDTHNIIPTITCTSSNVVKTILQASAEMPSVNIVYGPDTYMGGNLEQLFNTLAVSSDEVIQKLHPAHNRETIKRLLSQYRYFKQGICVVHHMFGGEVVHKVEKDFPLDDPNNFYTAHFEVPGEMFASATHAATQGKGVVGSTSNILNFITDKATEPFTADGVSKKFILGTEAGMVTGIVKNVQDTLKSSGAKPTDKIEIVFPVAQEAVAQTGDASLPLVPGVKGGEGCSTAGGCATCPFMKMNDLDALMDVAVRLPATEEGGSIQLTDQLSLLSAKIPTGGLTEAGNPIIDGTKPISYMRVLMTDGTYPEELKTRVLSLKAGVAEARV